MTELLVGEQVKLHGAVSEMSGSLEALLRNDAIGKVIRRGRTEGESRVLVRFNVVDPAFGMYWLEPRHLRRVEPGRSAAGGMA